MRKQLSIAILFFLFTVSHTVLAGDPFYPVSAIPDSLRANAHLVKRLNEATLKINDLTDARFVSHYVVTVLDETGAEHMKMGMYYDKLSEIRSISGALYDAEGKQLKRLKQSDIRDISAVGDGSLMSDTRAKLHQFYYNVYPYTVEYTIELRLNTIYGIPGLQAQASIYTAVEKSRLTVIYPENYELRYRSYLYEGKPVITTEKGNKTITWEVNQLPARKYEVYPVELYQRTPCVFLAPTDFELGSYKGKMTTWKDFGNFAYQLNAGRDVLPGNIKAKVHELVDGISSRQEKIRVLYKFLQQNNRYISIQLGIGGWQTFDAASVAANGYGDCKALSNYMMALLKEAGIKSNCVLVKAGDDEHTLREDFPSSQFNHEILCVPGEKDTTWLECTSNTNPAGYLGSFTDNRPVLLVDATDSKLIRTPAYGMDCNEQIRHVDAVIDPTGNIDIKARTVYSGLQQDDLRDKLHSLSREKQLEELREELSLSSYDINNYHCTELETPIPSIEEKLGIKGNNYATVTGKRMFLVPNILTRDGVKLEPDTSRKSDIQFDFAYRDVDSVTITLPAGYKPESLPAPVSVTAKFGSYNAAVSIKGNTLNYIRKVERKAGIFPSADYPELVKFYATMLKSDRSRLVLVKE
ncbi:hypothetical protein QFZ51_002824 [Chitinophaga sp. W3I9]|uniref:DUF3857 domain-containing protein n=1 Tax=Chitinophaga sp. W3I9 TaxID=3373924 RepID=UPI003D1C1AA5